MKVWKEQILLMALDEISYYLKEMGLHNGSEERKAKTYITALMELGVPLDNDNIEIYLKQKHQCPPRFIKQFTNLVSRRLNGRCFQGVKKEEVRFHIQRWRAKC